jgi:hypothetical protein
MDGFGTVVFASSRVIRWTREVSVVLMLKHFAWLAVCSLVPVSFFPHCQRFVELRKAFEREVLGIHVKSHDVELRVQYDVARVDQTSRCRSHQVPDVDCWE